MSDWIFLNKHRIPPGKSAVYGSRPGDGFNGAFHFPCLGIPVLVLASDGEEWQHVSVSMPGHPKVCPGWEMMCAIKDLYWEPEDCVMQLHVPKSLYVNHHPGCLHLWRPIKPGVSIPLPPAILVGYKFIDGRWTKDEPGVTDEQRKTLTEMEESQGLT